MRRLALRPFAFLPLLAAGLAACARAPEPRLVVLVVVDTLRDDHVNPELTPQILAAMAGARRFTDARANASWTLPSLASALTSRPVAALSGADGTLVGIAEGETALAERFRAAGFATAAFVANATLRSGNGFAQGFDTFETPEKADSPSTDGARIVERATAWLAANRGRDAFVWLHLMEPHEPWVDHEGKGRVAVSGWTIAGRERAPTADEARTVRELYASEAKRTDDVLGPFLAALPRSATILLTADHGELLGEGTAWGHGLTVYDPVLAVPFLLRSPGVAGGSDARPAELLDLAPTLAARALPSPSCDGCAGADLVAADPRTLAARPRIASTWSAGPLRWSYRRGDRAVLAHFAEQPASPSSSAVVRREVQPLPTGIWSYRPADDPMAARGEVPEGDWLAEVAAAVVSDIGRTAPGLHALVADAAAGESWTFAAAAPPKVAQIFATAPLALTPSKERFAVSTPAPLPFAMWVFAPESALRPEGEERWALGRDAPPAFAVPGRAFWRNPRPAGRQEPQAELVEHLRALGYIR